MTVLDEITGARLIMLRHLTWAETDAAGHNHFSAAVRWLEEGEHALWRHLGLVSTVPTVPRVHVELDFRQRIFFGDQVEVTVGVTRVGTTSATFGMSVRRDGEIMIESRHVVAHCPDPRGGAVPWTDSVREALTASRTFTQGVSG